MKFRKENGVSGMTSDAKIGLLLGLVLIVIIAFVLNGLPSLHPSQSNDPTQAYVRQSAAPKVNLATGPQTLPDTGKGTPTTIDIAPKQVATAPNNSGLHVSPVNAPIQISQADGNQTPAPTAVDPALQAAAGGATAGLDANTPTAAPTGVAVVPTVTHIRTYVVKKGDTLVSIAQKFYSTAAKKKTTLDALVKENHLKSAKQLSVGQKLVIPDITLATAQPTLFEKVEQISRHTLGIDNNTATNTNIASSQAGQIQQVEPGPSEAAGDYVVQQGDNPWRIAAKQLGNGNRYKEVMAANPDIFKGGKDAKLSVGMHLKLPRS
jgi:nucleoid-associated protein YgaU